MPKTSIYANAEIPGEPQRIRCEIGWAKDRDVQIAVTRLVDGVEPTDEFVTHDPDEQYHPATINFPDAQTKTEASASFARAKAWADAHVNGPEPTDHSAPQPAWQGCRMNLTRTQINLLIRSLRIARDSAYGRDE